MSLVSIRSAATFAVVAVITSTSIPSAMVYADEPQPVSFYEQIRPIFQAQCHGCHQPARDNGKYVMTDFAKLVAGGESESAAIVPEKPEESYLVDLITPADGQAEMPKGKKPLSEVEVSLIRRWVAEGAKDDTPEGRKTPIRFRAPTDLHLAAGDHLVGLFARRSAARNCGFPRGLVE